MTRTPNNVVDLYIAAFNEESADKPTTWAREQGYSYATLKKYADQVGINLPSRPICIIDKLVDWSSCLDLVDAHLLGDGSIVNPKKKETCVIQLPNVNKPYLEWCVANTPFWEGCNVWDVEFHDKRTNKNYSRHWIKSKSSNFLNLQRSRWYPNGKKQLPKDVVISKRGLTRLFIEDGTRYKCNNAVSISLNDFSEDDIQLIKSKIEEQFELSPSVHYEYGKAVKLHFTRSNNFFNIIDSCPVECFSYKWPS